METQLHIAYLSSKFSAMLGQYENSSTGLYPTPLPLVRMFDAELSALQVRFSKHWTTGNEISFLGARLNLYSYVLAQSLHVAGSADSPQLKAAAEFTMLGSQAAMRLVHIMCVNPDEAVKGAQHSMYCFIYAVLFLLRISGTAQNSPIDHAEIRSAISQGCAIIKGLSKEPNDYMAKTCGVIEYASNNVDWCRAIPYPGKASSLMANNFIADVVLRASERYQKLHEEDGSDGPVQTVDLSEMDLPAWSELELGAQEVLDFFMEYGLDTTQATYAVIPSA